jgi:CRP/FNR family transcriptional regulator, nitrogen fixation regulation protein
MEDRMHGTMQIVAQRSANMSTRLAIPSLARSESRNALDLLERIGTTHAVQRNEAVFYQDGLVRFYYRILSGCVRLVKLMEDGRRQVGEFLLPGDLFGFDDLDTHDFGAEAVCHVVLRRYPRSMVEALADCQLVLARQLRNMTSVSLRTAHSRLMLLGRKTATERVASFLLEMAERLPEQNNRVVDLPMTRSDVADHLGLSLETVCRILAQFRRDGTIAVEHGGTEICDRVSLEMMASESRH